MDHINEHNSIMMLLEDVLKNKPIKNLFNVIQTQYLNEDDKVRIVQEASNMCLNTTNNFRTNYNFDLISMENEKENIDLIRNNSNVQTFKPNANQYEQNWNWELIDLNRQFVPSFYHKQHNKYPSDSYLSSRSIPMTPHKKVSSNQNIPHRLNSTNSLNSDWFCLWSKFGQDPPLPNCSTILYDQKQIINHSTSSNDLVIEHRPKTKLRQIKLTGKS